MTVREYLIKNESIYGNGVPIDLRDVLGDGSVYCGAGYNQLMESLSETGLKHVANAKYVCNDIEDETGYILLYYLKDAEYYPNYLLERIAKKLKEEGYV